VSYRNTKETWYVTKKMNSVRGAYYLLEVGLWTERLRALHLVGCVAYWGNQDIIIKKYMKIESFLNVDVEKSIIWTEKIANKGA